MQKIVVLGGNGMAGHVMAELLSSKPWFTVYGVAREPGSFVAERLDVLDFEVLGKYLENVNPDYVVNCVGVLVKSSVENICNAININSYLPNLLSKWGNELDFRLIHISTDCVFSGREGGYSENSFRDGDDNYARTKALGEIVNDRDLTIRTSIIGPELKANGTGLLDWFLKQKTEVKGYTQAYWSGVTTLELATATCELIKQEVTGLIHLCPDRKISKYELLKHIADIWGKNLAIHPYEGYTVDKSLVCTRNDFDYTVPDYQKMLQNMKIWMDQRKGYYPHYSI